MFWLIYVTMNIKNVPCGSNAGMETSAPLIHIVINNALFHSNLHISQILPQIIHILHFFW